MSIYITENEEELNYILKMRDKDIKMRNAYVEIVPDDTLIIVPDNYSELRKFIKDWLPLCRPGTERRVEKFKKAIKRRSFFKGYMVSENEIDHMTARFIAGIKIEQCNSQNALMVKLHKQEGCKYIGYTYLLEISRILNTMLDNTVELENNNGHTVSLYDDLRSKY